MCDRDSIKNILFIQILIYIFTGMILQIEMWKPLEQLDTIWLTMMKNSLHPLMRFRDPILFHII